MLLASPHLQPQFSNPRYRILETISRGGMGVVHRALDRLNGETIALKQVTDARKLQISNTALVTQTAGALRLALAHEFQTLAGLRHPNIISVLDYGFDAEQQPFFTMTYLPSAKTLLQAGEGLTLTKKIELIEQLLQALAYLHRRGVLHRDLKPENVLVSEGVVRVLDFGLASGPSVESYMQGGTAFYTAPEIWEQAPYSPSADLYAVGVIACELLNGQHPFGPFDNGFLDRVLDAEPNLTGLEPKLAAVLQKLLAKDPAHRFQQPKAVLAALAETTGRPGLPESEAIRESFLQAATFVGREQELAQLKGALDQAQHGQGSAWLIGGESGVGKSRLANEVRTLALVNGFQVVRGTAVQTGGAPYQLWLEPIRQRLVMAQHLAELSASVLLPLIPDIEAMVEHSVTPAPALETQAAQTRLFTTIAQLFERAKWPILLILEDLHWAKESLGPLAFLIRTVTENRVMIVGTYSDDESPHLPDSLPEMHRLPLTRFKPDVMAQLSAAMLGDAGQRPELLDMLQRETEGNAFFAVEVLRALASDLGNLSQLEQATLPTSLLPRGIQTVVDRYLARVPPSEHELLQLAAVAGRELDLALLQRLQQGLPIEPWLSTCAEAAVLEMHDGIWHFRHTKIRDGLLATLPLGAKHQYHEAVARTLEQLYPDQPQYAAQLAHHWGQAHFPEKERQYALQAGHFAAAQFANTEALAHFTRAEQLTPTAEYELRCEILLAREEIQNRLGFTKAQQADLDMLSDLALTLRDNAKQTEIALRLADYAITIGDYPVALKHAQVALGLARQTNDIPGSLRAQRMQARTLEMQGYLAEAQALVEAALPQAQAFPKETASLLEQLGRVVEKLGQFHLASDYLTQVHKIYLDSNNLLGQANTLRILGLLNVQLTHIHRSEVYLEESLKLFRTIGNKHGELLATNGLGVLAYFAHQPGKAYQHFEISLEIARQIGARHSEVTALLNLGSTFLNRKGVYSQAHLYLQEGLRLAETVGSLDLKAALLMHLGGLYNRVGQYALAKPILEQALALIQPTGRQLWEAWVHIHLGEWHIAQGLWPEAQRHLQATLDINLLRWVGSAHNCLGWVAYQLGDYDQMLRHYQTALPTLQDRPEQHEILVSQLGQALAKSLLGQGVNGAELEGVLAPLFRLDETLIISDTPLRAHLLAYALLLRQNGDARAGQLAHAAYAQLQALADNIDNLEWHRSFLENIPEHGQVVEHWLNH